MHAIVLLIALTAEVACPIAELSGEPGAISWRALELGMSRAEVARLAGHPLELTPSDTSGGISHASVVLERVHLGLAFKNDDESLLGFTLIRSSGEPDECWSRNVLLSHVKSAFPQATYRPSRHAPDLLEDDNAWPMYSVGFGGNVILVKPSEGLVYAGSRAALD